tara:strand:- start:120 stop:917 length:798 start_codon:yes stop_codon:yes gene_type:complete
MHPLIIAAVTGYKLSQVETFIYSALQNTSYNLALITQKSDQDIINALSGLARISIFTTKDLPDPRHMAGYRFQISSNILQQIQPDFVVLSDSRDVFFQSDPFYLLKSAPTRITLATEPVKIKDCQTNSKWIRSFFGARTLSEINEQKVLCCGTIGGPTCSILSLLETLNSTIKTKQELLRGYQWGLDQASLNQLIYQENEGLIEYDISDNNSGPWLTIHHERSIPINKQGQITNSQGNPASIVHQYDRFPWLERHLRSQLLTLNS